VGPTSATHLSRWAHPNGTTKRHPSPSINVLNQYVYVYCSGTLINRENGVDLEAQLLEHDLAREVGR